MPACSYCVMNVVGVRPNMMKIAQLLAAMKSTEEFLVHTGQRLGLRLSGSSLSS